jgi:hypothetical protein
MLLSCLLLQTTKFLTMWFVREGVVVPELHVEQTSAPHSTVKKSDSF